MKLLILASFLVMHGVYAKPLSVGRAVGATTLKTSKTSLSDEDLKIMILDLGALKLKISTLFVEITTQGKKGIDREEKLLDLLKEANRLSEKAQKSNLDQVRANGKNVNLLLVSHAAAALGAVTSLLSDLCEVSDDDLTKLTRDNFENANRIFKRLLKLVD